MALQKVSISVKHSVLMKTLKYLMAVFPKKQKGAINITCELTVIANKAFFNISGANFPIDCITQGTCKATFSFLHFFDIIKTLKQPNTIITIIENTLQVNGLVKINVKTTFFENDKILRSILLPANYNDLDLLRISEDKSFTKEEIEFNNLTNEIEESKLNFERKINNAQRILSDYGITKKDIRELIVRKVFIDQ